MDRDEVEVHKHAKKELGQYPAILTSRLVNNNPYILYYFLLVTRVFRVFFYADLLFVHRGDRNPFHFGLAHKGATYV